MPPPVRPPVVARRNAAGTREDIRYAAARLFAADGFTSTSVRDIAREAAVDAALVIRYFGSKEHLFLETMTIEDDQHPIADGPIDQLGATILRRILTGGPRARQIYTALTRAADRADVRARLVEVNTARIVVPVAARLTGERVDTRAALIAAQINGLLNALWITEDPILTALPAGELIELYAAALQRLIDPPEPNSGLVTALRSAGKTAAGAADAPPSANALSRTTQDVRKESLGKAEAPAPCPEQRP